MVVDDESVQLSDYCFNVCEALNSNAAIRKRNTGDLDHSTRMALEVLVRCVALSCVLGTARAPTQTSLQGYPRD